MGITGYLIVIHYNAFQKWHIISHYISLLDIILSFEVSVKSIEILKLVLKNKPDS